MGWNDPALYPKAPRLTGRMIPAIKSYLMEPSAPSACLKVGATFLELWFESKFILRWFSPSGLYNSLTDQTHDVVTSCAWYIWGK